MLVSRALAIAAGLGVASQVLAVDITSGDASLNILESFQLGQFYPFNAALGDAGLRTDGVSSPDVLYKYCWYYKTNIGSRPRLFSELAAPSRVVGADEVTYTWTSNGDGGPNDGGRFDATLKVTVSDGAAPGQARVTSSMRVRNAGPNPTTIRLYNLVDMDLPGGTVPATDDSLVLSTVTPARARYTEASTANFGEIDAPTSDIARIDSGSALRTLLQANGTVDLSASAGPFNGDGAAAFQWTLALDVNEERTITTAFAINMAATAATCAADFDMANGVTVQDIFAFLNAWFEGLASADFNGGGLAPSDIFDFLNAWFAGCP